MDAPRTFFEPERRRAEARYRRLINKLLKEVEKRLQGVTDPQVAIRILRQIAASPQFNDLCTEAARQTVTMLAVGQKSSWRAAAASSSKGRVIYKALNRELSNTSLGQSVSAIVFENAKLIRTVPENMAQKLTRLVQQQRFEGLRPDAITREILKQTSNLREFEARRIARTESAKASTALVQARCESLDLDFYIWRTARDGDRVRKSHQLMEGVICRWSDPPNPEALAGERSYGNYHPGGIFNCRCVALPVIALEDIKFPAKVYAGGKIESVGSLKALKGRFGLI